MASARIQRWALLLSAYDYSISYKAGKDNTDADALSRLPLPVTQMKCHYQRKPSSYWKHSLPHLLQPQTSRLGQIEIQS